MAKKTILHAVRRQNEVTLALQAKILDMENTLSRMRLERVSTELVRKSSSLSSFKCETRSAIFKSKRGLGDITKTAKALPSTIRISSRQVQHNTDNDNKERSYNVEGEGKEVLAGIISQQEQRAFLHEDNAKRVD